MFGFFILILIVILILATLSRMTVSIYKFKVKIDKIPENGKGMVTIHWTNLKQNASVEILSPSKQKCNPLEDENEISPGAKECLINITNIWTYKVIIKGSNLGHIDFSYKPYINKQKINLVRK